MSEWVKNQVMVGLHELIMVGSTERWPVERWWPWWPSEHQA